MEMIPLDQVKEDLGKLFELNSDGINKKGSSVSNNIFHINKRHFERFEVLDKLQTYFKGKAIEGGYITVDPITFVITTFTIKYGHPPKAKT